jgi:hypothetical protein
MNFEEILEGWKNHLFPPEKMKEYILEVSKERMEICTPCIFNSKNRKHSKLRLDEHCTICGCTLSAKTKCLSCCCPKEYWMCVITEQQEEEINTE